MSTPSVPQIPTFTLDFAGFPEGGAYFPASASCCVWFQLEVKRTTHLSRAWTPGPSFPPLFLQVSLLLLCEGHVTTQEERERDVGTGTLKPSYR